MKQVRKAKFGYGVDEFMLGVFIVVSILMVLGAWKAIDLIKAIF